MRILQLCKKFPYPLHDGESIAVIGLSKSLHRQGASISLLAMNTSKHFYHFKDRPAELDHYEKVESVEVDNRVRLFPALKNLISGESYHVSRLESDAFRRRLIRLLQEEDFDIIQLETPYLSTYLPAIRRYSRARVVLRAHNVEHEIWDRLARNFRNPIKKWYFKLQTRRLRTYECSVLSQYDAILAITEEDALALKELGARQKIMVVPAGIAADQYQPDFKAFRGKPSLAFIGSMDWLPNQEGLLWFLREVWPAVQQKHPDLHFYVAGRKMPEKFKRRKDRNVHFLGEVPSAAAFINEHPLMVVPLQSGSGIRIKILEGMALGRVVISTSIGLQGVGAEHGREVFSAQRASDFQQCLEACLEHLPQLEVMGKEGRRYIMDHFDRERIARRLIENYRDLSAEPQPAIRLLQE